MDHPPVGQGQVGDEMPAADHAAEAIVIYDLHRPGRFEGDRAGVAEGGG